MMKNVYIHVVCPAKSNKQVDQLGHRTKKVTHCALFGVKVETQRSIYGKIVVLHIPR